MRDATKTRKIQILHHTKFKPVGWPLVSGCKDCGKLFKQRDMKQACEKTAGERLQDIQHTCACYKKQEQLNEYVLKHVGCKGKLRQSSLPCWNDLIHLVEATIVAFWKLLHSNPVQQHCERLPLARHQSRSFLARPVSQLCAAELHAASVERDAGSFRKPHKCWSLSVSC